VAVHISFRAVDFHASTEGVRIRVYTDVACHIYCRLTIKKPWIHKKARIVRGLPVQDDVRFCFVVFEDNEQYESGDTIVHTFWKPSWTVCTTKWCYFWGYVSDELAPSTSALFKYHNDGIDPLPVPEVLKTFNPIDPERIIVAVEHAWNTIDLTNLIHPDATGVILYWGFHQNVGVTEFKIRINGSVFDHDARVTTPNQGCAIVGVDDDKKIQIFTSETLNFHVYVIGYTGTNVHFFNEPIDISPSNNQVWETQNLGAEAPGAYAIIGEQGNAGATKSFRSDVRNFGSTDNYLYGADHNWWVMGCDAEGRLQTWVWQAGLLMKHWALGYIVGESAFYTNRIVLVDPPAGVWTHRSVKSQLAVPIYGIVHYGDLSTTCDFSIKKRWGYFDPYVQGRGQQYWPIHCLPDGSIEIIRQNNNGHFYVVGETE